MPSFHFTLPPVIKALWDRISEPSSELTKPIDRRNARMIAALYLIAVVMLVISRVVRILINAPESGFNITTFTLNTVVLGGCYILSRTRHYRLGTFIGILSVMVIVYVQSVYRAQTDPVHLTDSTVWSTGMVLIGGLIVSWQVMLILAAGFSIGLLLMPLLVPGLTIQQVRFSLEFTIGMSALITITAALRSRDLRRIEDQAAQLLTSETRYRTLLDAGFEAIIIHNHGKIVDGNDAIIRLSGYTMPELLTMHTIDMVAPECRPDIAKLYAQAVADNLYYETVLLHKDGHRVDIEVRSRAIEYHGQMVRVIALRDITESKQAREQLKNLFDNLDRVFFSFSAIDSHVIQISPACEKLYGYPPQVFYDDPTIWVSIIHPDDQSAFVEDFLRIAGGGRDFRPLRIVRPNGEIRWIEMLILPAHDSAGTLVRFDGLVTDMTERRQLEAQQREWQSERERSLVLRQFINDASHDLRTPLATLYTSLYLLRRVSPTNEVILRHLDTLEEQTRHLSRVVEDLFTMSRLDAPETYVEKHRLDLIQIMENIVNACAKDARDKHIRLTFEPAAAPLWVVGDKDYLLMALRHVVDNALQYTPADGVITIRSYPNAEHQACVEVVDTGIGIQPAEMAFIFDRFYRSDKARQTERGGVGLGLPLARKIIEIHQGAIHVESIPGQGSTFRINLPHMLQ